MFLDFSYYRKKSCAAVLLLNVGTGIWLQFQRWYLFLFTLEFLLICELCRQTMSEKYLCWSRKAEPCFRSRELQDRPMLQVLIRQVENCRDKAMYRDMTWKLSKLFVLEDSQDE